MTFIILIIYLNKKFYFSFMDQQEQDLLHLKQEYLKAEIIGKNLDQNKFLDFCLSQKENGDDLNNWAFDELKICVHNFNKSLKAEAESNQNQSSLNFFLSSSKSSLPSNQQNTYENNKNQYNLRIQRENTQNNNQNQNSYLSNYIQSKVGQPKSQNGATPIQSINSLNLLSQLISSEKIQQKINSDIKNISLEYYFVSSSLKEKYELACKKSEKNALNDNNIKVIIQNPKHSEKSLLSIQYTMYEIFTEHMNWIVQRRYSDFDWLRTILCKFYPRVLIPPIPGKKVGNRRFEQDFIEKRMKFLQIFIDEIMKNEELKTNEALYAFLSFNNRQDFERKVKELNNIIPSQYCEDLKSLEGKITILNDDFNENYYININNYFKLQYQILNRLNNNLKYFYKNITNACGNLEEVHKDFETLNVLNNKVKMKDPIIKTFEELSIFFKNWKRILFNQNVIIKEQIKHFFKYQKMENLSFVELIDNRELIRQKYASEKAKLDAKKEKLYKVMDFNKWEIEDNFGQVDRALLFRDKNYAFNKMCTRETQSLENIHKQLGYANYMNIIQLKNIIEKNSKIFVEVTKNFANEFYPSLNDGITLWSTLNTYL